MAKVRSKDWRKSIRNIEMIVPKLPNKKINNSKEDLNKNKPPFQGCKNKTKK